MTSGHLKIKKGPVLILATWRHTTESVPKVMFKGRDKPKADMYCMRSQN